MTQQEYISQWNKLFTGYVSTTLGVIVGWISKPGIAVEWKARLETLRFLLEGQNVCDVKGDLAQGIVTDETLDKTEKIYSEIGNFFIEISVTRDDWKESLKELFRQFERYRKQMTKLELKLLR